MVQLIADIFTLLDKNPLCQHFISLIVLHIINDLVMAPAAFLVHRSLLVRLQHFLDPRAFRFMRNQNAIRAGGDNQILRPDDCNRNIQLIDQAGSLRIGCNNAFSYQIAAHFFGQCVPGTQILPESCIRLNHDILLFFHHFIIKADRSKQFILLLQFLVVKRQPFALQNIKQIT
ncbi:hypothetical protein D3C80_1218550 [compost metagenome]